jgi:hypothetical protein
MHVPVRSAALTALASIAALAALAVPPAAGGLAAATWTPPRTAWGDPDFGGVWNYATMTPLERPREFADRAVLSPEDAAAYEARTSARRGEANNTAGPDWWEPGAFHLTGRRTSLIVDPPDGHVPPPPADRRAGRGRVMADNPEDRSLKERCLSWESAGPPMLPAVYNNNVEFVQTPGYVVIVNEMIHDARIVPTDGRPHGPLSRWMGDSRGRWEGNTLVVDTINFLPEYSFRGSSAHLHLVERFTRTAPDTIDYAFTVEDAGVWSAPWTAEFPMTRTDGLMYEYACHEGNARSMIGMLQGARVEETVK